MSDLDRFTDDSADLKFEGAPARKYDPNELRDDHGRWTDGRGGADPGKLLSDLREKGGFTYDPRSGSVPKEGFAVGVFPTHGAIYEADKLSKADVAAWLEKNKELLADKRAYIGGWVDNGKVYLDVSKVYPPEMKELAVTMGRAKNQIAIADLGALTRGDMKNAFIDTGGTGMAKSRLPRHFMLFDSSATADEIHAALTGAVKKYSPEQPRDAYGRWTEGAGSGLFARTAHDAKSVKAEWIKSSPLKTVSQVYAGAAANTAELDAVGAQVAASTGSPYKAPGIKKMPRVIEKKVGDVVLKIMAGRSPAGVTDIVRSTFITDTPDQADRVVAELSKHFPTTDEGWKQTEVGYVDRAVNVRFKNGQIGEVLLMPKEMSDAKSPDIGGGHNLFVKWRALGESDPRRAGLAQGQMDIYGRAKASLSPHWTNVLGKLGASGA